MVLVFVFISYIVFGAMVIREHENGHHIPVISPISKVAHFISMIPRNIKKSFSVNVINPNMVTNRKFTLTQSNFSGQPNRFDSYLLLSRFDGDLGESVVDLVDLNSFETIHTWNPDIDYIIENNVPTGGIWTNLKRDRNDSRARIIHPKMLMDGSLIFNSTRSPLIKIGKNSELIFALTDEQYHHSIEEDLDGNIWVCVSYFPYKISEKYVGDEVGNYFDDGIRKISPDGEVLFDKSVSEIFIENGLRSWLFGIYGHSLEKDPVHLNDIEPVNYTSKYWEKGDLFLSLAHISMILLYRPSTNEIIWKKTGENGDFFHQHDIDIISDTKISLFDNNRIYTYKGSVVENSNEILIYDFETDRFYNYLNQSMLDYDIRTVSEGLHKINKSGDLFIEETNFGRLFYFSKSGDLIWNYINLSKKNELFNLSWSRLIDEDEDILKIKKIFKN